MMDFIVNDIKWWQISLYSFMNGWLPGLLTFFLGFFLEKIISRKKLKRELKNNLLEIFIPTFNSGEKITLEHAKDTNSRLKATFNAYKRIHPDLFNKESEVKLTQILTGGLIVDGQVNKNYLDPDLIQRIISEL